MQLSVITTGGTIASATRLDRAERAVEVDVAVSLAPLIDRKPPRYAPLPSTPRIYQPIAELSENLVPADYTRIINAIEQAIRDGAETIIVTHGTDTMAFTCCAAAFALGNVPVPVVFTGAMRPLGSPGADGPIHFWDAVTLCRDATVGGVFLLFNSAQGDSIAIWGPQARPMNGASGRIFEYLNDASIAYRIDPPNDRRGPKLRALHDPGRIIPRGDALNWTPRSSTFVPRVRLMRPYPGQLASELDSTSAEHYDAVVLDLYHAGTACARLDAPAHDLAPAIAALASRGIVTFGCNAPANKGSTYASLIRLIDAGLISIPGLGTEAAYIKAMWLIGQSLRGEELVKAMKTETCGEFAVVPHNARRLTIG
ncbi:MAG TPA: asparaginase domain-containing protein [Tepidisphaeraceae bacterium]|jgi:L-asparaginase